MYLAVLSLLSVCIGFTLCYMQYIQVDQQKFPQAYAALQSLNNMNLTADIQHQMKDAWD